MQGENGLRKKSGNNTFYTLKKHKVSWSNFNQAKERFVIIKTLIYRRNKLKILEDGKTSHVHRSVRLKIKMAIQPKAV